MKTTASTPVRFATTGPGTLVISLDFELHWGLRDHLPLAACRQRLLGVRRAVPALLALFSEFEIHATWATVGFLLFSKREELLAGLPEPRPAYRNRALDPYAAFDRELGRDEQSDPFHYAASLVRMVAAAPHQEIGSHTFSHYYCLEPGQDRETFRADLEANRRAANRQGIELKSLVFPRNQVNRSYLPLCRDLGIACYRGNLPSLLYREQAEESLWRRAGRLADAYLPISGDNSFAPSAQAREPINIPASRFLRPYSRRLAWLDPLRARRIKRDLTRAARAGRVYHLWWHPHNFGERTHENVHFLREILTHFRELQVQHDMRSLSMGELCREVAT